MNSSKIQNGVYIYQIYYDEKSKNKLDSNFIGLDNLNNPRPDWYEFLPIRNFLSNNELNENSWYGFLSPKFTEKTGLTGYEVMNIMKEYQDKFEVFLLSFGYDQLAYFKNPFLQGEIWHSGLIQESQKFIDFVDLDINLENLVTCSTTSNFGNYIIAKPKFWREWLLLANKFYDYVELGHSGLDKLMTNYGHETAQASMKTFIQERLNCIVLTQNNFKTKLILKNNSIIVFDRIFEVKTDTVQILKTLDLLKEKFILNKDDDYLNMFYKLRQEIKFITPF